MTTPDQPLVITLPPLPPGSVVTITLTLPAQSAPAPVAEPAPAPVAEPAPAPVAEPAPAPAPPFMGRRPPSE